jgi:hypothetical protein
VEPLPLAFLGWLFTLLSGGALVLGALIIIAMHRSGELHRRFLAASAWNDMALFAVWILGLSGGIGVLQGRPWGRDILEFFSWTLIALVLLSAATRLLAVKRRSAEEPANWVGAIAGVTLVLVPVLALCAAAIVTLRSDAVRQAMTG